MGVFMSELPERRRVAPYIPLGVTQQGRLIDGQRIEPAECGTEIGAHDADSMRAHRRMASWARGILLSILALLALVGAGALYGAAERYFITDAPTTTTTTRTTT